MMKTLANESEIRNRKISQDDLPILRQMVTISCSTMWLSSMTSDLTDPSSILTLITLCFFLNSSMSCISSQLHIHHRLTDVSRFLTLITQFLAQLSYSYKLVKMLCVCLCLDVNQGSTNSSRCTQTLVILHAQTY